MVFSWSPPPVTQHSGLITSYTLTCSPSLSSLPQSSSQSGLLTVAGFSPDTSYILLFSGGQQWSGIAVMINVSERLICQIFDYSETCKIYSYCACVCASLYPLPHILLRTHTHRDIYGSSSCGWGDGQVPSVSYHPPILHSNSLTSSL